MVAVIVFGRPLLTELAQRSVLLPTGQASATAAVPAGGASGPDVPSSPGEPKTVWHGDGGATVFHPSDDPEDASLVVLAMDTYKAQDPTISVTDLETGRVSWSAPLDVKTYERCGPTNVVHRVMCRAGARIVIYDALTGANVQTAYRAGVFDTEAVLLSSGDLATSVCTGGKRGSTTSPLVCDVSVTAPSGKVAWSDQVTVKSGTWHSNLKEVGGLLLLAYQIEGDDPASRTTFDWLARNAQTGGRTEVPDGFRLSVWSSQGLVSTKDGVTSTFDAHGRRVGALPAQPVLAWGDPDGTVSAYVGDSDGHVYVWTATGEQTALVAGERPLIVCGGAVVTAPAGDAATSLRISRDRNGKEIWRVSLDSPSNGQVFCDGTRVIETSYRSSDRSQSVLTAYGPNGIAWTHTETFPGANYHQVRWLRAGILIQAQTPENRWMNRLVR